MTPTQVLNKLNKMLREDDVVIFDYITTNCLGVTYYSINGMVLTFHTFNLDGEDTWLDGVFSISILDRIYPYLHKIKFTDKFIKNVPMEKDLLRYQ